MNRRGFIASASAAAISKNLYAGEYAGKIIDAHTHFYDPTRPGGAPWPPQNDTILYRTVLPPEYRKMTERLGVVGTIVVEASPWLEDNQWVLDLAAKNPVILGTVGHLEPGKPDFQRNLKRFSANPRFRGIRIGALRVNDMDHAQFLEDVKALHHTGLMLDILGDGDRVVPAVLWLSDRIPDLRIVIDHLPFQRPDESAELHELKGRTKVFAKVSNVPRKANGRVPEKTEYYRAALDQIAEVFGNDRVIYGSNWPVSDKIGPFETALKIVRTYYSSKGGDAAAKYFYRNALAAYRLALAK